MTVFERDALPDLERDMPERVRGLVARLLGRELLRGLDRAPEERGLEGFDLTLGAEGCDSLR